MKLTIKRAVLVAGFLFALFNLVAYRHAYRLTHFVVGLNKTRAPNRLTTIQIGQSMGAAAVLRAVATEKLTPAGVVVECPYDRLLTTVKNRYGQMGFPAFPAAQTLVFWGGVQHGFNAFRLNPVEYARQVRCPALVIAGQHDPWVKVEEADAVAQAMRGATAFAEFEKSGHAGYAWTEPERYRNVVVAWFNARGAGNGPRSTLGQLQD